MWNALLPLRKWLFTLLRHRNSDSWHAGSVILRLVPSGEEIVEFPLEIDNGLHPTSSEASGQSTSPSQRHLWKTQKNVFHLHFAVLIYLILYSLETSMGWGWAARVLDMPQTGKYPVTPTIGCFTISLTSLRYSNRRHRKTLDLGYTGVRYTWLRRSHRRWKKGHPSLVIVWERWGPEGGLCWGQVQGLGQIG